jgi:hypothetical protein
LNNYSTVQVTLAFSGNIRKQNIRNIKKLPSRSIFTMWGIARFFLYEYDLGVKTPERRRTDNKR